MNAAEEEYVVRKAILNTDPKTGDDRYLNVTIELQNVDHVAKDGTRTPKQQHKLGYDLADDRWTMGNRGILSKYGINPIDLLNRTLAKYPENKRLLGVIQGIDVEKCVAEKATAPASEQQFERFTSKMTEEQEARIAERYIRKRTAKQVG